VVEIYDYVKDEIYKAFPSTIFFFIVSEETKKKMLHFHCIVAIRNFIDYNKVIKNNINNVLLKMEKTRLLDVKVQSLLNFISIKN
jgi:hypothetical protein